MTFREGKEGKEGKFSRDLNVRNGTAAQPKRYKSIPDGSKASVLSFTQCPKTLSYA